MKYESFQQNLEFLIVEKKLSTNFIKIFNKTGKSLKTHQTFKSLINIKLNNFIMSFLMFPILMNVQQEIVYNIYVYTFYEKTYSAWKWSLWSFRCVYKNYGIYHANYQHHLLPFIYYCSSRNKLGKNDFLIIVFLYDVL